MIFHVTLDPRYHDRARKRSARVDPLLLQHQAAIHPTKSVARISRFQAVPEIRAASLHPIERGLLRAWQKLTTGQAVFLAPPTSIEVTVDTHAAYRTRARNADRG